MRRTRSPRLRTFDQHKEAMRCEGTGLPAPPTEYVVVPAPDDLAFRLMKAELGHDVAEAPDPIS